LVEDDELITNWGLVVEGFSRAMHALHGELDESLTPVGFGVVLRLERTPGHRLPMTQLAREVELTSGGFTKVADRLTAAGLTRRVACESDRRVTWMELTDGGLVAARTAKQRHADALRRLVDAHLSLRELEQLGTIMRKLRDGIDAAAGCPSARSQASTE
jgi:DNA-binding MarR family transcriptional regulator